MKLIFALGNPGPAYRFTRHNFGALALDFYAKISDLTFTPSKKFQADIATSADGNTLYIKPTSFYNEIGRPIAAIIRFYKVPLENILVVCDDFSLPFGTVRLRSSGSAGGNNGLRSIIEQLGTDSPTRAKLDDADFVLSRFTPEEQEQLPAILKQASTYFHPEP